MSSEILLSQVLAFVRASFSKAELKTVEVYGGQFSAEEIPQVGYTCPAVFVTVLGWQPPPAGARLTGRHAKQYRLAAFVAYKHADRAKRMQGAMALAEQLAVVLRQWVPMREPGNADLAATICGLDDEARAENLYNRAVDKAGQALWVVSWYQCAKGDVPIGPMRPAVPYEQLPDMVAVGIEDTTHVAGGPLDAVAPAAPVTVTVTEKIDFLNP